MKKVLSLVLVVVMLCSSSAGLQITSHALPSSGSCGENVTYTFDSATGLLKISGSGAMTDYYYSHSPFYQQTGIKTVVINNGVTSIGEYAFFICKGLTSITIPDSVTSIGDSAFYGCSGLTSVTIPDSVTSIGENAFEDCSGLTNITIPDSVTSIGEDAFYGCSSLISITIPDSVTSIGEEAFVNCSSLTHFAVASGNKKYDSRNNCNAIIESSTNKLIIGCKNTVIPDSVTSIGEDAFYGCSSLTSITIPDSVTSIGDEAFQFCSNLTSVTIPDSVTSIGEDAFYGCNSLTSITIPDSVTSIGVEAFYFCRSLKTAYFGNGIESINKSVFNTLTTIGIPADKRIDFTCFDNCTGLQVINLTPGETGKMVDWSSDYADSLWYLHKDTIREVNLEEGITNISDSAFNGCSNLIKTNVPSTVRSIGRYAYAGCSNLRSITISSPYCTIPANENTIDSYATIYGYNNSTAKAYADKYDRAFVSLGDYTCEEHNVVTDAAVAPTCTKAGLTQGNHCSRCGEQLLQQEEIPALGHVYEAIVTKPSATTLGYTTHRCSRCDELQNVDSYTAPTGKLTLKHSARTVNAIKVQWNNVKSATGYQVQISAKDGKKWDETYTLKAGVTSYTFKKLAAGNNYKFRVRFFIKAADGKNYYSPWSATLGSPTLPTGTTLTKLTAAKKAFNAQWKKNSAVNGYQVQYGVKSNFSGAKTLTVKNAKTLKAAVKKLSAKKVYYVRIRTYKTISKVNYFSTWSKIYKVKTK